MSIRALTFSDDRPLEPDEHRREWSETVACEGCGYLKRTRIVRLRRAKGYADEYMYRKLCTPCEQERSALYHEQTAKRLREQARATRAKRKKVV